MVRDHTEGTQGTVIAIMTTKILVTVVPIRSAILALARRVVSVKMESVIKRNHKNNLFNLECY